jgi:hypothetical protein
VARGIGLAPPPTRQKAPKSSRVSIYISVDGLGNRIKSAGWLTYPSPARIALKRLPFDGHKG